MGLHIHCHMNNFLPTRWDEGINVFKQKCVDSALSKWSWSTVMVWIVTEKALGTCLCLLDVY